MAATAVLCALFTFLYKYFVSKAGEGAVRRLRDRLFSHILGLPYRWHVSVLTGDILQRCTSDVDVVRGFLTNQLTELCRIVIMVAAALLFMFFMSPPLAFAAAFFSLFTMLYTALFHRLIQSRFREADEAEGRLSTTVLENVTGVRVVRAFGAERAETEKFDRINRHYTQLWFRLGRVMSVYWGLGDLTTGLMTLSVILLGCLLCVQGQLTLGQYIVFLYYTSLLVLPIRSFGRILSEFSKVGVSLSRIGDILSQKEEDPQPAGLTPPMDGGLAFESVSFAYPGAEPVLKDVSFSLPGGKTLGVLGLTGSGKSTLTYLLTRLYPASSGKITVSGVDIGQISLGYLRKNVGLVLQEPFLFSRSIAENIAALDPCLDRDRVIACAKTAELHEAVMGFPEGYDTVIGERGVTLSGGQRQRVAIARLLYQAAPIMIFDDSLSAVDAITDQKIRAALKKVPATKLIISHRVSTLMDADRIIVLQDGRVVESGSHQELLDLGGLYCRVCRLQQSAMEQ